MSASTAVFLFPGFFTLANCIVVKRVCVFLYVHAHVQVCVSDWRPEADIRNLSQSLSNLFTEAGSRGWTQNLPIWQASRGGLLVPGIPSTFPVLEVQACHQSHLTLTQVPGTWTLVLRLTGKCSKSWPLPQLYFSEFKKQNTKLIFLMSHVWREGLICSGTLKIADIEHATVFLYF